MNDILGRSIKQDVIKEIKLPEKTVTSTEEFVYVLNEHQFLSISVPIWLRLFRMKMTVVFRTLLTNKILNLLFSR